MKTPILEAIPSVKVDAPDWEVEFPDGMRARLHAQIFKASYLLHRVWDKDEKEVAARREAALSKLQNDVERALLTGTPKVETAGGTILRYTAGVLWLAALARIPRDAWRLHVVRSLTHATIGRTNEAHFVYEAGLSLEFPK